MSKKYCKLPLWECSRELSATARGRRKADTVITNARLMNVCTGEILPGVSVAIACGRIALVGDAAHCIGPETKVVDAHGQYIAPGLLDGHIHVESSMMSVSGYANAVIPHGTVGIYYDPHEITNVLGLEGMELLLRESEATPLKAMLTVSSCVPAVPGFEDSGSAVTSADIAAWMQREEVVGLGEMMNFPGILASDEETHAITGNTLRAGKVVTGHYSVPEHGRDLNAYIAAGVRCCHESTRAEDALEKMRLGMYAMFRNGSAWQDLRTLSTALTEHRVDSRFACLVSDDIHPRTLRQEGHLDHLIRLAISYGIDPMTAVQMATLNVAQCFRMDHELGSITPGRCADIVFVDDLIDFHVTATMIDGEIVAENGEMLCPAQAPTFPHWAMDTMHLGETVTAETFRIPSDKTGSVAVRVIEVIPASAANREQRVELKVQNGLLESDAEQDVLKAFVFERHHATGKHGMGFVKGFHIRKGAMASTVSHDAHNLLVLGTNDEDMALAAHTLMDCGGGMCVVAEGRVLGLVELPLAGLMSTESAEEMEKRVAALDGAWKEIGCDLPSPFMTMALIPLACIPELRLTDRGLVDCNRFAFTTLEE